MSRAPVVVEIQAEDRMSGRLLDSVIRAGVDLAVFYYRTGKPGRGAYELARLAIRVNRLLDHQQQAEGESA